MLRAVTLYRDGQRVDSVKLRYRSEPLRVPGGRGGRTPRRAHGELAEQTLGVAPGQTACLMDGDRVVGHGTIAASA